MADKRRVLENLEELEEVHQDLLELLEAKREAVSNRDVENLEQINQAARGVLGSVRELHAERKKIWENLSEKSEQPVTLDDVCVQLEPDVEEGLREKAADLRELVADVQRLSGEIAESLSGRLQTFDRLFGTLLDSVEEEEEEKTYDEQGERDQRDEKPSVVIDEAV